LQCRRDTLLYSTYSATDDISGSVTNGDSGQFSVAILRDSDNAVRSFTPAEVADGTANTWVQAGVGGAANGFVRRGYDQSVTALDVSNLNHADQSDPTKMPKSFDSSTGLILENGKAAMDFDAVDDTFNSDSYLNGLDAAAIINISSPSVTNAFSNIYSGFDSFTSYNILFRYQDDSKISAALSGVSASGNYATSVSYAAQQNLIFVNFDNSLSAGNQVDIYLNGADANTSGSNDVGTLKSPTNGYIGSRAGSNLFNGNMQVIVIYPFDFSSINITAISDLFNTEYNNIY